MSWLPAKEKARHASNAKRRIDQLRNSPVVGQQASEQVATLQAQVDRLGQRLAEEEVSLDVQKQTSKELSAKLDSTSSDLQREARPEVGQE